VAGKVASHVETGAVVGDYEGYTLGIAFHPYLQVARAGVFDGIVEDFLGNAVNGLLRLKRSLRFVAEIGFDLDAIPGLKRRGLLLERCDHSFGLQCPVVLTAGQTNERTRFVSFADRFDTFVNTFVNYSPISDGQRTLLRGPRCRRRW
jgi:hypothetical protein